MGNYLNKRNVSLVIKQKIFAQSISFVIKIILIVTAMLRNMAQNDQQRLIDQVEGALYEVKPDASIPDDDTELLRDYVKKLLKHPRQ